MIDKSCPVGPCAIERDEDHFSLCEDFACEKPQTRIVDLYTIQAKFEGTNPEKDQKRFITPYENKALF